MLSKISLDQTIKSEGTEEKLHLEKGGHFKVSGGATEVAGYVNIDFEKYLSNIVK